MGMFRDTQRTIGEEKLKQLRMAGFDSSDPESVKRFREEEMKILGGFDPQSAMQMQNQMEKQAGLTKWDRQIQALQSPEVQQILADYDLVLGQVASKLSADPKAKIFKEISKLESLENQFMSKVGKKMPNLMSRQLLNKGQQERKFLEAQDDDAWRTYEGIMNKTIPELDRSIRLARVGYDSLGQALNLMESKWDSNTQTFSNPEASDIQSAIKMFVRSLDGSVVMQGEVENIVGSNAVDSILKYPKKWLTRENYSKEQTEMIFKTMIKSAKQRDKMLNNLVDGTIREAKGRAKSAFGFGEISAEEKQIIDTELEGLGSIRAGKYQILDYDKEGNPIEPVGIFKDISGGTGKTDTPPEPPPTTPVPSGKIDFGKKYGGQ